MFFGPDFITVTKVSFKYNLLVSEFCCHVCGSQMTDLLIFWQTDEDVDWTDIKRHVSEAIAKFFESGDPITTGVVYNESSESHSILVISAPWKVYLIHQSNFSLNLGHCEDDDDIVSMIKELLDTRIR